ncbi:hypothetical protein B0H13DRAFT_1858998 [Mycena leptocephala]|nr:hypothetical protein B0H13DRAFT_1858998 [Mycena leptocephala]
MGMLGILSAVSSAVELRDSSAQVAVDPWFTRTAITGTLSRLARLRDRSLATNVGQGGRVAKMGISHMGMEPKSPQRRPSISLKKRIIFHSDGSKAELKRLRTEAEILSVHEYKYSVQPFSKCNLIDTARIFYRARVRAGREGQQPPSSPFLYGNFGLTFNGAWNARGDGHRGN